MFNLLPGRPFQHKHAATLAAGRDKKVGDRLWAFRIWPVETAEQRRDNGRIVYAPSSLPKAGQKEWPEKSDERYVHVQPPGSVKHISASVN
jgi:hypothetical protein